MTPTQLQGLADCLHEAIEVNPATGLMVLTHGGVTWIAQLGAA